MMQRLVPTVTLNGGVTVRTSRATGMSVLTIHLLKKRGKESNCPTLSRKGVPNLCPKTGSNTEGTKTKVTILPASHL